MKMEVILIKYELENVYSMSRPILILRASKKTLHLLLFSNSFFTFVFFINKQQLIKRRKSGAARSAFPPSANAFGSESGRAV